VNFKEQFKFLPSIEFEIPFSINEIEHRLLNEKSKWFWIEKNRNFNFAFFARLSLGTLVNFGMLWNLSIQTFAEFEVIDLNKTKVTLKTSPRPEYWLLLIFFLILAVINLLGVIRETTPFRYLLFHFFLYWLVITFQERFLQNRVKKFLTPGKE